MKEDNTTTDPTWMAKTGGFARDMTLRDHYAGLAMQGIVLATGFTIEQRAGWAYRQADAMLKAGERKHD
jgi:hypothetical protein